MTAAPPHAYDPLVGERGQITEAARAKGAAAKRQRGVFNRYVRALEGKPSMRVRARLREIEEALAKGTRVKKAPVFENGSRVGTVDKELPLLPSERAHLLVERRALYTRLRARVPEGLRDAFIAMMPDYAERNGFTRDILLASGVPAEDLDLCGILE